MKYLFIGLLVIILPFSVFSQSNYYPGYVLKNNGDTLKGYINYREWIRSPKTIDFKIDKSNKTIQLFNPKIIRGFRINGLETYKSYTGFISRGKTGSLNLMLAVDTNKKAVSVFLRQMTTGQYLTLFDQSDNIKTRFFVAETNGTPVELAYYEYLNNLREVTKLSAYKGQLISYINKFRPENDKLINDIENIGYNAEDLQNIINNINGNSVIIKKSLSTRFFLGIDISYTTAKADNRQTLSGIQTSTSIFPKISAGIDVFGNPTIQQLIFRAELTLSYIDPKFKAIQINSATYGPFHLINIPAPLHLNYYSTLLIKTKLKFT